MNEKYYHLLFDELLYLYINGDSDALEEAMERLKFCDFDKRTIKEIIEIEILIIKYRKLKFKPSLFERFWWLSNKNKYNKEKLLNKNRYNYCFNYNKITNDTLTLSELISIFDEAYYLVHIAKDVPSNIYNESFEIAEFEDYRSWIISEIYNRLELCYRKANNIIKDDNFITDIYRMHTFYDNEFHILINYKWNRIADIKNKWMSYTDDYYN